MTVESVQVIDIARSAARLRRMWNGARLNYILPLIVLVMVRGPLQPYFDPGISDAAGMLNTFNLTMLVYLPYLVYVSGARSRFGAGLAVFVYANMILIYLIAAFAGIYQQHVGVIAVGILLLLSAIYGVYSACSILFNRTRRDPYGPLALARHGHRLNRLPIWWRTGQVIVFVVLAHSWMILLMGALSVPAQYLENYARANEKLPTGSKITSIPEAHEVFLGFAGGGLAALAIILATAVLIIFLTRLVRRWLRARAEGQAAKSAQDPILLLRSFADDVTRVQPDRLMMRFQFRKKRLEEVVASLITPIGTFIGIGSPNERLPQLGAQRAYFEDDTWQDAILHWIGISRFVVMVAGLTEWVQWELRTLIEKSGLERLIILIPPDDRQKIEARFDLIRGCFSETSWEGGLVDLDADRVIAILFTDGGKVLIINGHRRDEIEYRFGMLAAMRQLGVS